jgi:hypothetical protein
VASASARAGRGTLLKRSQNHFEDAFGIPQDVIVPEAKDLKTSCTQPRVALPIPCTVRMLTTIDLNHQRSIEACEVDDVAAERNLPLELVTCETMSAQPVPQAPFGVAHVAAQCLDVRGPQVPLPARSRSPPSPLRGEGTRAARSAQNLDYASSNGTSASCAPAAAATMTGSRIAEHLALSSRREGRVRGEVPDLSDAIGQRRSDVVRMGVGEIRVGLARAAFTCGRWTICARVHPALHCGVGASSSHSTTNKRETDRR